MNRKGTIAIGEILIMVIGIFAVAWAIGSEIKTIVGQTSTTINPVDDDTIGQYEGRDGTIHFWNKKTGETARLTPEGYEYRTSADGKEYIFDPETESYIEIQSTTITKTLGSTPEEIQIAQNIEDYNAAQDPSAAGTKNPLLNKNQKDITPTKKPGLDISKGSVLGSLWEGVKWAGYTATVVGLVNLFASKSSIGKYTEALQFAAPAGMFVGKTLWELSSEGGAWRGADNLWGKTIFEGGDMTVGQGMSIGIGAAVTVAVFVMMYSEEEEETITFTCDVWDAPSGGNDCEKCNNNKDLPCSEYQCKSLGQSCELQNANSDNPLCSWVNRKDVVPPTISLWEDVLTQGLRYTPVKATSPEDKGTTIVSASTGGCIPAYTPLAIGIKTDEPAKCKVDVLSKKNISDMSYYFGSSLFLYNHTFVMSVPGQTLKDGEEKIQLKNDGIAQLYVRCQDPNGNANIGNFIFKFCVDPSEDTTAPQILGTNIINEMPVAYNADNIALELYTNEPADCRWDALDKGNYEDMKNTMSCNQNANEMNAQMVYTCKTNLNGIKSGTGNVNNFYFKCRDKPTATSGRNTNAQNYKLTLYGTEPLILDSIEPNGTTIKDNTDPVWVELTAKTSAGYKDGDSSCYYKLQTDREYLKFFTTGSATHSQKLAFETGKYNVSIKCVDAGGNSAEKSSTFEVEIDKNAPEIQRIYKDTNNLRTTTNEEAECVYDTSSCSYQFNDGIAMTTVDKTNQFTEWKEDQTYYIKCRDKYGNQPDAGSCTIEARMYEKI